MEIDLENIQMAEEVTVLSAKGLSLSLDIDRRIISIVPDKKDKLLVLEMNPAAKRNRHSADLKHNEQPCVLMMNGNVRGTQRDRRVVGPTLLVHHSVS